MVVVCSAPGCSAKKDSIASKTSVQFHRFPLRKPEVLAKWVKAMKNPNFKPTVTSYLCSAHFTSSDYDLKPTPNGKHLKPTAVPTVFEKRRPGRKKKILSENEVTEEIKENEVEFIEGKELEEGFEEEYLEVSSSDKVQTDLAEIIGDQDKGTLQVLIVGEDGKITNSEYIFKKEMYSDDDDDDSKTEFDTLPLEDTRDGEETDDEILSHLRESNGETESQAELSSNIELLNIRDIKNKEKIKRLKTSLMITKRKVKVLQMKCGKMSKTIAELKILLKLLVLKRGKGEKNLKELLEEYEKNESEDLKMSIKEEEDYS